MGFSFELKNYGKIWVSDLFTSYADADAKFLLIKDNEVQSLDKIQREISAGKKIVLIDVKEKDTEKLYAYLEKRSSEIVGYDTKQKILSKNYSRDRKKSLSSAENTAKSALFILAENDAIISFKSKSETPLLFGLCGNDYPLSVTENSPIRYLLPYKFYLELIHKYQNLQEVTTVKQKLFAGPNVLIPKSPETYEIFAESINFLSENIQGKISVLDLGCGSGVLSLLFASLLKNVEITATDILPEAIATTRFNLESTLETQFQIGENGWQANIGGNSICLLNSSHLFNKVRQKFDIISFNAPWVPGKPRNRSELALHDDDQKIVREFLVDATRYLAYNGKLLLGYSDNGGEDYLADLEDFIVKTGWKIEKTFSRKVQSYQSGRKWLKIIVYVLAI